MPARKLTKPRNTELAPGVGRFSRHKMYTRKGVWAVKNKKAVAAKKDEKKPVSKPFGKKGATRTIRTKEFSYYPAEDIQKRLNRKSVAVSRTVGPLRSSITPGTVLILLAGDFKGKRVVFLKRLDSGLLLVTGPYKVNGVPLKRVDQAYVIATSTKLDISSVKIDAKFNDAYFTRKAEKKTKKGEQEFFADAEKQKEQPKKATPEKVADQKAFDAQLLPLIAKVPNLEEYLGARFGLRSGQFPHDLKF